MYFSARFLSFFRRENSRLAVVLEPAQRVAPDLRDRVQHEGLRALAGQLDHVPRALRVPVDVPRAPEPVRA